MDEDRQYLIRRRIVAAVSVAAVILFTVLGAAVIGRPLIEFLDEPDKFREWAGQGIWGPPALVGIMVVQVVISLIPGGVVELAAGYCYGGVEGGLICSLGGVIGSGLVFLLVRKFGVKLVEAFISREKLLSLSFMKDAKRLHTLIFILYLIPGTPKDVFNYFVGLTPIKLRTFLIITAVARAPAIFATTICGDAIIEGDYLKAAIVFTVMAACSIAGMLIYRKKEKTGS